jgi:hypothetical protein
MCMRRKAVKVRRARIGIRTYTYITALRQWEGDHGGLERGRKGSFLEHGRNRGWAQGPNKRTKTSWTGTPIVYLSNWGTPTQEVYIYEHNI